MLWLNLCDLSEKYIFSYQCCGSVYMVCAEQRGKGHSLFPAVCRRMTNNNCPAFMSWLVTGLCWCACSRRTTSVLPQVIKVLMSGWWHGTGLAVPVGARVSGMAATGGHAARHVGPGQLWRHWAWLLLQLLHLFAGWNDAELCWAFAKAARSRAAGHLIPCALLTEILIYAIRNVKNEEFQHGSHFACALQWVSANSSAVVCSAWNPGEWLLSRGISSDLIAKL